MKRVRIAKDIMVTKLVTITPETDVFEAVSNLLKYNLTGAPVIDEKGHYVAVFSERPCLSVMMAAWHAAGADALRTANLPKAGDVMAKNLVTLTPDADVFDAIALLLQRRISGAPVLDRSRRFLGVFSEHASMTVLLDAAYQQMPTSRVRSFIDPDRKRIITEDVGLLDVAQKFLDTQYRRLPVLRGETLVGQISRRDVLRAAQATSGPRSRLEAWREWMTGAASARASESTQVAAYMDTSAPTVSEDTDLLRIAQIFRKTSARRVPVVQDGHLTGQISRRDLLYAINDLIAHSPKRENPLLYLSSLDHAGPPIH